MKLRIVSNCVAAAFALTFAGTSIASAEDASVLYRKSFGSWTVLCRKDLMKDDKRGCVFAAKGQGPNLIGQDTMLLEVWSEDKTKKIVIRVMTPYILMVSRGFMFRMDKDDPVTVACTRKQSENNCDIQGNDRDVLVAAWQKAGRVVVRAFTFNGEGKDFQFDMAGFTEGLADFQKAVEQYL